VKLVHLVGLIIKKFVMVHGHMNVKTHNFFVTKTWLVNAVMKINSLSQES